MHEQKTELDSNYIDTIQHRTYFLGPILVISFLIKRYEEVNGF